MFTMNQQRLRRIAACYIRNSLKRLKTMARSAWLHRELLPPVSTFLIWLLVVCMMLRGHQPHDIVPGPPASPIEKMAPLPPAVAQLPDPLDALQDQPLSGREQHSWSRMLSRILSAQEIVQLEVGRLPVKAGYRQILSVDEGGQKPADQQNASAPAETAPAPEEVMADLLEDENFSEEEKTVFRTVFDWLQQPEASCRRLMRFPGGGSPADHQHGRQTCLNPPSQTLSTGPHQCLIYSFSRHVDDWAFDEAMAALGCEVHVFNPSLQEEAGGERSPNITLHRVGLGRNSHTDVNGWRIATLDEIMQELGHVERRISYLRSSTDGWELDMLAQQLQDEPGLFALDRVEQLGLDVRLRPQPKNEMDFYRLTMESLRALKERGFRLVDAEPTALHEQPQRFPGLQRPESLAHRVLLLNGNSANHTAAD